MPRVSLIRVEESKKTQQRAESIPDPDTPETIRARKEAKTLVEQTVMTLRALELLTPNEFYVVTRLSGLFACKEQTPEEIARDRRITVQHVRELAMSSLGTIQYHQEVMLRTLKRARQAMAEIDPKKNAG